MKMTPSMLRKMVVEEAKKLGLLQTETAENEGPDVDVEEIKEPGDYADTLEKKVDMLKAMKVHEAKLVKSLRVLRERKEKLIQSLKQLMNYLRGDKNDG